MVSFVGLQEREQRIKDRQNKREAAIMEIYSKTGGIGLKKIFGSDFSSSGDQTSTALNENIDSDDIPYTSSKAESDAKMLKNFGMSDEALARFASSADPTVFERLLGIVKEQKKLYEGQGLTMPEEIITQIVEQSPIVGPTSTGKINIKAIEKYVGRELDDLYKGILEQQDATGGSVTLFEPTFVEPVTPSDITSAINLYSDGMKSKAVEEKRLLNLEINRLNKIDSRDRTEDQTNQITLLSNRLAKIDGIFELKKENQPFAFANLYGNSWIRGFIERNPKYKVEDFPSMYTSAVNIYPQVSSEEMALALYSAGVFEDNTIVQLPDGTTRRLIP
jgi:hypothetical protein